MVLWTVVVVFEAGRGADPQIALGVADDGADQAPAQFIVEAHEALGVLVVHGEAGGGRADPDAAGHVHVQGLDKVAGQAGGIGGVAEAAHAVAVPARQAGLGADPDKAVAILRQRHRHRVRHALVQAQMLEQRRGQLIPAFGTGRAVPPVPSHASGAKTAVHSQLWAVIRTRRR
jgi:hypothetical protein